MESWQIAHIQRNRDKLIKFTKCTTLLAASLQKRNILTGEDKSRLDAKNKSEGEIAESSLLFDILETRNGSFNALIEALKATNQTGSLEILQGARADGKHLCLHAEDITDSTNWDELSDTLKSLMYNKLVLFQGSTLKLHELLSHYKQVRIDGKLLHKLAKDKSIPIIVNNQVPDEKNYNYTSRVILARNRLSKKVFLDKESQDIFVVEGIEKYKLTLLVREVGKTDVSCNQINNLTVRFIHLEFEADFEKICKLSRTPVHWITYQNEVFKWVKSSGSVANLQKFVSDIQDLDSFDETQMASMKKVVVITDSPGMGKTTLLVNIANRIMNHQANTTTIVRFLILKEFVQAIILTKKPITIDTIIELIAEQSSEFEFGRNVVAHALRTQSCILMLDGFDEVLSHQLNKAIQILQTVTSLKPIQVFVTARLHMREELENSLEVLGYTIQPFGMEEQVNFLLSFWKSKNIRLNDEVKQFAEACINELNNLSASERDIAGLPLQCKLLAEIYQTHAHRCSKHEWNDYADFNFSSLFEMYKSHIKMRFKKGKYHLRSNMFRSEDNYSTIKRAHMYHALELLFPEHIDKFQKLVKLSLSVYDICGMGLIETSFSNKIQFVHRTFAEYLVAWFVAKNHHDSTFLADFILSEIFCTTEVEDYVDCTPTGNIRLKIPAFKFSSHVVCYFINGFTKTQQFRSSTMALFPSPKEVKPIYFAAAYHNYSYLPLVVLKVYKNSTAQKTSYILRIFLEVYNAFKGSRNDEIIHTVHQSS